MTAVNYPATGAIILFAICLIVWMLRANQKDRNSLRQLLPGNKLHRKHLKKNNLRF